MQPNIQVPKGIQNHTAWLRLEDQLSWYDTESTRNKNNYKRIKTVQLIIAATIPLLALCPWNGIRIVMGSMGALLAILEGVQQLNQYSQLWIEYRSTAETLKHEKFLFLSEASVYSDLTLSNRLKILAQRIEEHISTQHAKWINSTLTTEKNRHEKKGG